MEGLKVPKAVTLRDISARAGVSPATVSNVLNGRFDRVSHETARHVMAIAKALGYRSQSTARGSLAPRTETLGIMVSSLTAHVFSCAVAEAQATAARLGYNMLLSHIGSTKSSAVAAARSLVERAVDGIVYISSSMHASDAAIEVLKQAGRPFVIVNRLTDPEAGLHLLVENMQGTYEATQHLIELGHRRIGCIHLPVTGPKATAAATERLTGFRQALHDYGIDGERWLYRGVLGEENAVAVGYAAMCEMLSDSPAPTAVVCGTDYLAIGALEAAQDRGLRVPDDVAIVGHDDTPAAKYLRPALTSVRQPMDVAGARAVEALVHHLWRGVPLKGVEHLPCRLVVRDSSKAVVMA